MTCDQSDTKKKLTGAAEWFGRVETLPHQNLSENWKKAVQKMVFCYQNCSDLLWEKIVLVIEKNVLKFEAEGPEFAKFLRSLEQFIQTVKGQNNVW